MRSALLKTISLFALSGALVTIALTQASSAQAADTASGALLGNDGKAHGTVTVTDAPKGVILRVVAEGLAPGWHGMHFHEKGSCVPPKFTSAGGHVHAVTPVVHGLLTPNATDAGDLPNLYVAKDGTATVELYSTLVSLHGVEGRPALKDADGSALIIHTSPDDYTTQPIGGAGARVACAVLN